MKVNSYHNWLVPIEIAKKLKEIGFDEYCIFYTRVPRKDEISGYVISVCHDAYDRIIPGIRNKDHIDTDTTFGVSLPTFEQVFEWFREKGLVGTIEYEDFILDDKTCYHAYRITDKLGDILFYSPNYRTYETYEEAREALAIKLIEFYENNI